MYRSGSVHRGTFHVELENDDGKQYVLSVFSPKMKAIRNFSKLDEKSADSIDETAECISDFLSRNRENIVITAEEVLDIFDVEEMSRFIEDFFDWIADSKKK